MGTRSGKNSEETPIFQQAKRSNKAKVQGIESLHHPLKETSPFCLVAEHLTTAERCCFFLEIPGISLQLKSRQCPIKKYLNGLMIVHSPLEAPVVKWTLNAKINIPPKRFIIYGLNP